MCQRVRKMAVVQVALLGKTVESLVFTDLGEKWGENLRNVEIKNGRIFVNNAMYIW